MKRLLLGLMLLVTATAASAVCVAAERILTTWGCGYFLGRIYVVKPKLSRYSMGLR